MKPIILFLLIFCGHFLHAQPKSTSVVFVNPTFESALVLTNTQQRTYYPFYIIEDDDEADKDFMSKLAPERPYCTIKSYDDYKGMLECMDSLLSGIPTKKFDYLIDNGEDAGVYFSGKLRTHYNIAGLQAEPASYFTHKDLMKKRIVNAKSEILTAKFVTFSKNQQKASILKKINEELNFPIMIKEIFSCGSMGVTYVDNRDQLEKEIAKMDPPYSDYIAEEFVPGKTYRIDGYVTNNVMQRLYPSCYESSCYDYYKLGKPQITYTDFHAKNLEEYTEFTEKVLDALDYQHGIFHLEVIRHAKTKKLYFLEIAARPGSNSLFLLEFELNVRQLHLDLQLGINVQAKRFTEPDATVNCAVVDFPNPQVKDGAWNYQTLRKIEYRLPNGGLTSHEDIAKVGDTFEATSGVPSRFISVGFVGENPLDFAKEFRSSVSAEFEVKSSANAKQEEVITWPPRFESVKRKSETQIDKRAKKRMRNK